MKPQAHRLLLTLALVAPAVATAQYVTPNGNTATESRESTGTSLEVSYAPTRNWDIIFNVDQVDNKITAVGTELADFFAARETFYRKWFKEGIVTTGTSTASQDFAANVAAEYSAGAAFLGTSNRGLADYQSTLVARYKFLAGSLNGLTVGANLRWESGKIIGYGQTTKAFNFGGLDNYQGLVSDLSKEYKTGSVIAGGMMINYTRRILDNRVRWKIQLNAQDIFSARPACAASALTATAPRFGLCRPHAPTSCRTRSTSERELQPALPSPS